MHQNHSDSLCTLHLNGFLASFFPTSTKSFLNECLLHLNGVYTFCISSHKHFQPSVKTFVVFNSCWRWSLYVSSPYIHSYWSFQGWSQDFYRGTHNLPNSSNPPCYNNNFMPYKSSLLLSIHFFFFFCLNISVHQ